MSQTKFVHTCSQNNIVRPNYSAEGKRDRRGRQNVAGCSGQQAVNFQSQLSKGTRLRQGGPTAGGRRGRTPGAHTSCRRLRTGRRRSPCSRWQPGARTAAAGPRTAHRRAGPPGRGRSAAGGSRGSPAGGLVVVERKRQWCRLAGPTGPGWLAGQGLAARLAECGAAAGQGAQPARLPSEKGQSALLTPPQRQQRHRPASQPCPEERRRRLI